MIDIHSHILPQIDDGPGSLELSLAMARQAVKEGIRTVIATPHYRNGNYHASAAEVKQAVKEMNRALRRELIPLLILPGQEVHTSPGWMEELSRRQILTLTASRYVLLEFPRYAVPKEAGEWMEELREQKVTPIIAHPERNFQLARHPGLLAGFIEHGALCQLTAHSVTGGLGRKLQKISLDLCRRNLVHFIASDAHNTEGRSFCLREAYAVIHRQLGEEYVDYYKGNTECIIYKQDIIPWKPKKPNRRFLFWKQEA